MKIRTKTTWILAWGIALVGVTVGVAWQSSVSAPEAQSSPGQADVPTGERSGVRMTLVPEWSLTPPDARTALFALELEAVAGSAERRPVSLAVVLDTSGSMHGKKIENGRAALVRIIEHLRPGDQVSVVTFDTAAEIVVENHQVGSADHDYVAAVGRINVGGGTCIDCGLRMARTLLSDAPPRHQRRLLLISDGRATVGQANPEVLAGGVRELLADDVVTSALGVGRAVNEQLLARLANDGAGIYQFVRNSATLDEALAAESADLRAAVATHVQIDLTAANGATVEGSSVLEVPQLRPGTPRRFLIRVALPAQWSGDLLTASARWQEAGGGAELALRSSVNRGPGGVRSWAVSVEDARAQNAQAMTGALARAAEGDRGQADRALVGRIESLPAFMASAPDWVKRDMGAEQREMLRIRDIVRVEAPTSVEVRGNYLYQQFRFNNIDNGNPAQVTPVTLEDANLELE